ncbi:MAG TPA: glycosyltransferase family 4 protein [Pyrinomonadaceae bacterium]|jgi:glycosyltransferase involved in cell wall biosynthesis
MTKPEAILFGPLPPPYGGVAVFMSSLKNACIDSGVEVWSYAGDGDDTRVKRVNHRSLGHIWRALRLTKGARITDSTHFHIEHPHWLLLPLWLLTKRLKKFKWIKACHDGSLPFRYKDMSARGKRRVAQAVDAADLLFVSSSGLAEFFRDEFRRETTHISPLMPLPDSWSAVSGKHRADDNTKRVVSIGAFIPSYGFHEVAAAVERLSDTGRGIELELLDAGFAADHAYRRDVLKDRPWIRVREGVPHPQVGQLLAKADVFVRAFAHESYGLSRVEAILSGTPVIATNIGETRGMLTYESGDIDTLARHIRSVLDGSVRSDIAHWQEVYRHEATENLRTYIELITGASDA